MAIDISFRIPILKADNQALTVDSYVRITRQERARLLTDFLHETKTIFKRYRKFNPKDIVITYTVFMGNSKRTSSMEIGLMAHRLVLRGLVYHKLIPSPRNVRVVTILDERGNDYIIVDIIDKNTYDRML